jgi:hypothetical protein
MNTAAFWASAESPERLWIGTERSGVWYSESDELGALWQSANSAEFSRATVTALAVDPRDPNRVALGFGPVQEGAQPAKGVRVSENGGTSWERVAFSGEKGVDYVSDLAFASHENSDMLFAALYGQGIWVSRDGGANWAERLIRYEGSEESLNNSYYISAIETVQPADQPGCELLIAAGIGGVWARDIASIQDTRIFLPFAWMAAVDNGLDSKAPLRPAPRALPTPASPKLVLPER